MMNVLTKFQCDWSCFIELIIKIYDNRSTGFAAERIMDVYIGWCSHPVSVIGIWILLFIPAAFILTNMVEKCWAQK